MCGFEGMYHKPQKSNKEINKYLKCASGSVVEYRLAKARVAGSNPVSRFFIGWNSLNFQGFRPFLFSEIFLKNIRYGRETGFFVKRS